MPNNLRCGYSYGTGSVSPFVIRPNDMRSYVKVIVPRPIRTLYVPYDSWALMQMRTFSMSAIMKLTKHGAIFHFVKNFLFTVAPSTKGGCFSGGRGKNLTAMLLKTRIFAMLN